MSIRAKSIVRYVVSNIEKSAVYDVDSSNPEQHLIDRSHLPPESVAQIGELMAAFVQLREAELVLAEASQKYMNLNATDMKAIQYLRRA